jgi:hypothetical protein
MTKLSKRISVIVDETFPWQSWYPTTKQLPNGHFLALARLTFGRLRLILSDPDDILDAW